MLDIRISLLVIGLLTILGRVYGWPEGAPFKTCVNRHPKHSSTPQQSGVPPYQITVNSTTYKPNQYIEVILESKPMPGLPSATFKGFQINARRQKGDKEECVGEFSLPSVPAETNVRLQFWYPETAGQYNCATHRDKNDKTRIRLLWRSTSNKGYGFITFRAGVVMDFKTFWSDVKSDPIRPDGAPPSMEAAPGDTRPSTPPTPVDFTTSDCGTSRGCVLYPPQCNDLDCDYAVTFKHKPEENSIEFQLMGPGKHEYLSLAYSKDDQMGEDDTTTCISSGTFNGIQRGYNPGHYNDQHRNMDTSEVVVTKQDGHMICSFVRPVKTNLIMIEENHSNQYENVKPVNKTIELLNEVNLQMAFGDMLGDSSVMSKHVEQPLVSKVNLFQHDVSYASSLPLFIKFHAMLGFLAWITLSGCAIVISRHCRELLKRKFISKPLWFQLHRGLALVVGVLTVAIIVIVFIFVGGWSKAATTHAILALITTGLASTQILVAFVGRPEPNSPRRPYFNWFHRLMGVVTQLFAITAIIFGTQVSLLNARLSTYLVRTVAISVALQIVLAIIIELLRYLQTTDDANRRGHEMTLRNTERGTGNTTNGNSGKDAVNGSNQTNITDQANNRQDELQNGNNVPSKLGKIRGILILVFFVTGVIEVIIFGITVFCY